MAHWLLSHKPMYYSIFAEAPSLSRGPPPRRGTLAYWHQTSDDETQILPPRRRQSHSISSLAVSLSHPPTHSPAAAATLWRQFDHDRRIGWRRRRRYEFRVTTYTPRMGGMDSKVIAAATPRPSGAQRPTCTCGIRYDAHSKVAL